MRGSFVGVSVEKKSIAHDSRNCFSVARCFSVRIITTAVRYIPSPIRGWPASCNTTSKRFEPDVDHPYHRVLEIVFSRPESTVQDIVFSSFSLSLLWSQRIISPRFTPCILVPRSGSALPHCFNSRQIKSVDGEIRSRSHASTAGVRFNEEKTQRAWN